MTITEVYNAAPAMIERARLKHAAHGYRTPPANYNREDARQDLIILLLETNKNNFDIIEIYRAAALIINRYARQERRAACSLDEMTESGIEPHDDETPSPTQESPQRIAERIAQAANLNKRQKDIIFTISKGGTLKEYANKTNTTPQAVTNALNRIRRKAYKNRDVIYNILVS